MDYIKHQHSVIVVVVITKMDVLKNYQQYILHFSLKEEYVFRKFVCCVLSMWENYPLQQFSAEKKSFSISSSLGLRDLPWRRHRGGCICAVSLECYFYIVLSCSLSLNVADSATLHQHGKHLSDLSRSENIPYLPFCLVLRDFFLSSL